MKIWHKILAICIITLFYVGGTSSQASADSSHCGDLTSDEFWSASQNVHVVTCDVIVPVGHTLTIDQGAIVKFELGRRLIIDGTLIVQGSFENPSHFTSIRDDSVGGDTNGDGGDTVPSWNDWQGILFRDTSSDAHSLVESAVIRYAGYYYGGSITLEGASPTIQNTTLSDGHMAIRADLRSFPILLSNTYRDNQYNALGYDGGTLTSSAVWGVTDTSYFIIDTVYVGTGATLRIRPGTIIKFNIGAQLVVDGALRITEEAPPAFERLIFLPMITQTGASLLRSAQVSMPQAALNPAAVAQPVSTQADPVIFTSIRDDSVGGDSNGDGGASVPDWNNWRGILFRDSSDDDNSLIDNAVIRYAGYYYGGSITLNSASPTIQNTVLSDGHMAIRADLRSLPTLSGNTYRDNQYNALGYDGGTIDIDTTWSVTDTSILLIDNVYVGTGRVLTVEPGVVVKSVIGQRLIVDGALRVLGTATDKIYFTSVRDDTVGGDTNGDGSASAPDWNNWHGILFRDGSDDANSLIDNTVIRYAGYYYQGNITLEGASPTIRNTILSDGHMAIRADLRSLPILSNNTYQDNDYNALSYNGGTVNADTTWSVRDTSIILTDYVYVGTGTTLTIEPGVIIKLEIGQRLIVDGALRVMGVDGEKVSFTSIRDDAVGGDSNGDGGASVPDRNNWHGILFRDGSDDANSLIDNAVIQYAGYYYQGSITLEGASPTIQNTVLSDGHMAIRADLRSLPTLSGNTYRDNQYNALGYVGGTIDADSTWDITDTSILIIDYVYVGTGTILTIEPGVIVKFGIGQRLIVDGTLRVLGTSTDQVFFTSLRDDAVGGDTNGDGSASAPNWNDWHGILFREGSDDENSLIDHAVVRYGGYYNQGNITLNDASPIIQYSTLSNGYAGIRASDSQPTLTCNNLQDNYGYGIYNDTPEGVIVSALNQWWGSASGPYHESNPYGEGNEVTDGVNFDPWNLVPCGG